MIIGTGIDIIEVQRISEAIKNPRFLNRVFSAQEQAYCESRGAQRVHSYAARFAGKEAVMKALGTGLSKGRWLDIEIVSAPDTKPSVYLSGFFAAIAREMGVMEVHLSLSHSREFAIAQTITAGGVTDEGCYVDRNAPD